jgi:TonB family protein
MTLVEILTQRLPQSGPKQEMLLPETLPEEFAPLVRACLRPDPRRRAPLGEIMAMFRAPRPEPEPAVEIPAEPPAARRRWLSLALVSAAAVAMAGIFAAPRLINRPAPGGGTEPPASLQNVAAPETAKPEIRPAVETAAAEPANPAPAAAPPPTPAPAPVEAAPPPVSKAPAAPVSARKMEARPDQVVHQVMPDVTDQARRTIRGKVKVNVLASVDASGKVSGAKVESENSRYFANLSLQAARKWEFAPSESAGEWLLRFEFTTKITDVHPAKVSR